VEADGSVRTPCCGDDRVIHTLKDLEGLL
jgi:hypothetical protein